jgi:hypothetical protein
MDSMCLARQDRGRFAAHRRSPLSQHGQRSAAQEFPHPQSVFEPAHQLRPTLAKIPNENQSSNVLAWVDRVIR